ncbi:MAG: MYXO-CTERM sorting domain-containing protein [Kofleriaceae bacterium]
MRLRTIGLAAALSASLFQTSDAVVRPRGAEDPVVTASEKSAPRSHRMTTWSRASQMDAIGLRGWTAMIDRDTGVPVRMWGAGIPTFGAMANPAIAERAAREFIQQHLATLAPGAQLSDFVVVANVLDGAGVRSVGFQQHVGGVPVMGGTIGISFKADRLVMAGSTALPNVAINATPRALDLVKLTETAQRWLAADGYSVALRNTPVTRVILPLVRSRATGGIEFHLVDQLSVESTTQDPGRWNVWIDATTGAPIARATTLRFASGRVLFAVPDRSPTFGLRSPKPAPNVSHMVNTVATMASDDGTVTWADGDATIVPGLTGPLVQVSNKAGSLLSEQLTLQDGGEVVWDHSTEEFNDAQISAFVFASTAKAYARAHMNPELQWLDDQLPVVVNENQTCNAFSTGDDIHFYKAAFSNSPLGGTSCQNTARIADVVYHEFGHSLHAQSVIPGFGDFGSMDAGALSEGMADMLAAFITKDHGMGRGFFFGESALRDLDPTVNKKWPDDLTGEVHDDGEIIGGTMWDLRGALIAKLGDDAGEALARKLYYAALRRSPDIPTTYPEVLLADDDDGNLENGTPNQCEINTVFGAHGLANPKFTIGLTDPVREGSSVSFKTNAPQVGSPCPAPGVQRAVIDWKVRGGEAGTAVEFAPTDTTWTAALPEQKTGTVLQYKVSITLEDGTSLTYPNNEADPFYEYYVGEVETLWCADFEDGGEDWTHAAIPENRDEWEVGMPMGLGGDPKVAHGGENVLGLDLSSNGEYRRSAMTYAESPEIDLAGNTNVRLQYYRWLTIEDGTFDVATIFANDQALWSNAASGNEDVGGLDHLDKEWRFQDVDLSAVAAASTTGTIKLKFDVQADQGENKGGWTIDDVCVVIAKPAPECELSDTCDIGDVEDNGCCSVGSKPYGGFLLSLATLGLVLRRRRRT